MREMLIIAEREGIRVKWWDFEPPILGLYWHADDLPPYIGLDRRIEYRESLCRCVMAEELGHHFTSVGHFIPNTYFHYRDRLSISKAEFRAYKWAACYLVPQKALRRAIKEGKKERWELAEYFNVTDHLMDFRMRLPDVRT